MSIFNAYPGKCFLSLPNPTLSSAIDRLDGERDPKGKKKNRSLALLRVVHHVMENSPAFSHILNLLGDGLEFVPSQLIQSPITLSESWRHQSLGKCSGDNAIH